MADLFSMKNRVVLLTGASRGLGRDMALTLAAAGATVLCAGRTVKELDPYGYLIKPISDPMLKITVQVAIERHRLNKKLKESEEALRQER